MSSVQQGQPIHPAILGAIHAGVPLPPDIEHTLQSGYNPTGMGGGVSNGLTPSQPPQPAYMQGLNPVQQNFIRQQQANGWTPGQGTIPNRF